MRHVNDTLQLLLNWFHNFGSLAFSISINCRALFDKQWIYLIEQMHFVKGRYILKTVYSEKVLPSEMSTVMELLNYEFVIKWSSSALWLMR